MRLVAWNANHNNRRRSLEENIALLRPFHADILVISETARPAAGSTDCVRCIGDSAPALVVVAKSGFELEPHPENGGAPDLLAAWQVSGPVSFKLLAAWPVQRSSSIDYHQVLMQGLDRYGAFLKEGPAVLAGDLNTSSRVQKQKVTHFKFVECAREADLLSVYHEQSGEAHGEETQTTFRKGRETPTSFHIDYCFVSASLAKAALVSIPSSRLWLDRSDHSPVVLDIPDSAVREAADPPR
jgi:exodeoxyribonuclease-3